MVATNECFDRDSLRHRVYCLNQATIVSIAPNKDIPRVHSAIVWPIMKHSSNVWTYNVWTYNHNAPTHLEQTSIVSPDKRITSFRAQFITLRSGRSYPNWYRDKANCGKF